MIIIVIVVVVAVVVAVVVIVVIVVVVVVVVVVMVVVMVVYCVVSWAFSLNIPVVDRIDRVLTQRNLRLARSGVTQQRAENPEFDRSLDGVVLFDPHVVDEETYLPFEVHVVLVEGVRV